MAWLAEVLDSRDRNRAAPTFMPEGLYLARVGYPAEFEVPGPHAGSVPWSAVWADDDAPRAAAALSAQPEQQTSDRS